MLVRVLLQSNSSVSAPSTTDWQLYWEKNGSGTWTQTTSSGNPGVSTFNSINLTTGNPTTNRLVGGGGTFEPGKVGESGVAADVGLTGGNFTELLFTITVKSADFVAGDVIRLRVLKNFATSDMTYTRLPTLTVYKTTAKTQDLVDTFDTTVDKSGAKWGGSSPSVVWDASGQAKIPCTSHL